MINEKIEKSATQIFEITLEKFILPHAIHLPSENKNLSLDDWKMALWEFLETLSEEHAKKVIKNIGFTKEKRFPISEFKQKIMDEVLKKILVRQHGGKYD